MRLPLQQTLQFTLSCIAIIGSSITISFTLDRDPNLIYVTCLTIILFSMSFIWRISILKKDYKNKLSIIASSVHSFNHNIRDAIEDINESNDAIESNSVAKKKKTLCQSSVDLLAKSLTQMTGKKISVHLKQIPVEFQSCNIEDAALKTFCCCVNTGEFSDRHTVNSHFIKNTVPYMDLCKKGTGHRFYSDFKKIRDEHYKDTGELFIQDNEKVDEFYGSVAYVSIRFYTGKKYDVRGIIAADYKDRNAFKKKDEKLITDLMKVFADGLYMFLSQFNAELKN